jgi:hypothetical protein
MGGKQNHGTKLGGVCTIIGELAIFGYVIACLFGLWRKPGYIKDTIAEYNTATPRTPIVTSENYEAFPSTYIYQKKTDPVTGTQTRVEVNDLFDVFLRITYSAGNNEVV